MFLVLSSLATLAQIVCLIIVVIKMFQDNKVGLGIVSIICGIVAFVVGWQNIDRYRIRNVMYIWTAALVINVGTYFLVRPTITTTTTNGNGQTTVTR